MKFLIFMMLLIISSATAFLINAMQERIYSLEKEVKEFQKEKHYIVIDPKTGDIKTWDLPTDKNSYINPSMELKGTKS